MFKKILLIAPRYVIPIISLNMLVVTACAQESGPRGVFLQGLLRELSRRTGDVFTLESYAKDIETNTSPHTTIDFALINEYTSPEKLVPAYFPRYVVERSSSNPKLCFVICKELKSLTEYGVSQKIGAFQFKGTDSKLISKIGESVGSIKNVEMYTIGNLDRVSQFGPASRIVSVSSQSTDVRHALSAGIDFDKTKGIAWVAITRNKDGKQETDVAYTEDAVFRKSAE